MSSNRFPVGLLSGAVLGAFGGWLLSTQQSLCRGDWYSASPSKATAVAEQSGEYSWLKTLCQGAPADCQRTVESCLAQTRKGEVSAPASAVSAAASVASATPNSGITKVRTQFPWMRKKRLPCMSAVVSNCSQRDCSHMDLYQFGIFQATSMAGIAAEFRTFNANYSRFWGFDSFQGLPDEGTNHRAALPPNFSQRQIQGDYDKMAKAVWFPGSFNMRQAFRTSNFMKMIDAVEEKINDPRANFIRGFYNESLTAATFRLLPFRPALYVDIDVDLYSSTYQALEWLAQFGLLVPGTIIGYDDWVTGGENGEQRAHKDILEKFPKLRMAPYTSPGYSHWPGCFIVTETR
ncbi:unnamed protein product [Symbiodinium sp. CCMP2456]|nr:unnamed protein product [Symbiodinium sp. CCMP2456]